MASANNHNGNWQEIISDPTERRVFEGLANPAWDFRTIGGLARETKMSEAEVKGILDKYPGLVRKSLFPDLNGHSLFTLSTRPVKTREVLAQVRNFLAKSIH